MNELRYQVGRSTEGDIRRHLVACDEHFVPPLHDRVDIDAYARKLAECALTIEAWQEELLVGLVAAYVSAEGESCFVSNVSVLPEFRSLGIATALLRQLVEHRDCAKASSLTLEVSRTSQSAVRLYERLGFAVATTSGDLVMMRILRIPDSANVLKGPAA